MTGLSCLTSFLPCLWQEVGEQYLFENIYSASSLEILIFPISMINLKQSPLFGSLWETPEPLYFVYILPTLEKRAQSIMFCVSLYLFAMVISLGIITTSVNFEVPAPEHSAWPLGHCRVERNEEAKH